MADISRTATMRPSWSAGGELVFTESCRWLTFDPTDGKAAMTAIQANSDFSRESPLGDCHVRDYSQQMCGTVSPRLFARSPEYDDGTYQA